MACSPEKLLKCRSSGMLFLAFLYGFIFSKKLVSFKCKMVTVLFFTCHHGLFSLLTPTGPLYGGRIFNIVKKG